MAVGRLDGRTVTSINPADLKVTVAQDQVGVTENVAVQSQYLVNGWVASILTHTDCTSQ